jgi:hypothetical protein
MVNALWQAACTLIGVDTTVKTPSGPVTITPAPRGTPDPWIETLAWLMDSAIPLGRWSVGLDGLLGLIPGFGDLAGAVISMLIVVRAVQAGIPRIAITRMLANVAIDALVGTVPLFGDAFDFAYKANTKNVRIYRESLAGDYSNSARHWLFFLGLAVAVFVIVLIPLIAIILLVRAFGGPKLV